MYSPISDENATAMAGFWNTVGSAEEQFIKAGFSFSAMPQCDVPIVTADILNTLSNAEYVEAYVNVLAWLGYAGTRLARINAILTQIRNAMKHMEAAIRSARISEALEAGEKKPSVQELKDTLWLDPNFLRLVREEQEAGQHRGLVNDFRDNMEGMLKLFSRNVEIRKSETELNRIEGNFQHRGGRSF